MVNGILILSCVDTEMFGQNGIFVVRWVKCCRYWYLKGVVRYGTFKFINFKKNGYIKVPVVRRSLILCPNRAFVIWFENLHFVGKIVIHKQQCAQMCRGVACKLRRQESAIGKASLHADHPPMYLIMPCKCTMIWYCNSSLCKKGSHYFCHGFVLFTLNSKLSFLIHYVNLLKGGVLMTFCVSTLTL